MAKKPKTKKSGIKIEIISKSLYPGSGPRGVDVYARHLYDELSRVSSLDKVILSKDKVSGKPAQIVHYTFFDPFFLTLWGKTPKSKYVVTVHDLIPLKFPAHFPVGIKGKIRWFLQRLALTKASAIITDSVCSQKDISQLIGLPTDKIFVVPLAAGHTLVSEKMVKTVKAEYKLPERYLLYVGDINWNKNVPGLIKAFGDLKSSQTHLVLVGKAFESSKGTVEYKQIETAIAESGKFDYIHMLGFVPSHHLPSIYRGATLYVQPSWYEGFGFPILEAMEQNTPVLSSSKGSLMEVGGDHAHYFDPANHTEFVAKIKELLKHKDVREKYLVSAKTWAHSFNWEKVVEGTHAVYEKIIS